MGLWKKTKPAVEMAEHLHFGETILSAIFDWKGAIAAVIGGSGGAMTFFAAALKGRDPLDVWVLAVVLAAALMAIVYLAILIMGKFRRPARNDGGISALPTAGSPALKIEPGSGPLFESLEALSTGQVRKTSKIVVTNAFGHHLCNCRVQIKYIAPHPGWHLPQKLHLDTFSLAAGESKYIELASFFGGDKIRLKLPPSGTFDYDPDLPLGRYVLTLEATADQIKPIEAFVSVSVDSAAQLQVRDAISTGEPLEEKSRAEQPLLEWKPMFEAVAHVAKSIGDANADKCWPATRLALRQAAYDKRVKMKGRKHLPENNPHSGSEYSSIFTDVDSDYWATSEINALATSPSCQSDYHTDPQTAYAWGKLGIYERNRYAELRVSWADVLREWP
jgi:hypothetical protein